jgi:hypothetical protein
MLFQKAKARSGQDSFANLTDALTFQTGNCPFFPENYQRNMAFEVLWEGRLC